MKSCDLISRWDAVDDLHGKDPSQIWDTADIEVWINALPSVQHERIRGRWVYGEDEYGIDGYSCNKCGFFVQWDYTHKFIDFIKDYHFCPNCGAGMSDLIKPCHFCGGEEVKPTDKQIEYARYLAERMGQEMPQEFTKEAYSKFIDRWRPIVRHEDEAMNEPSSWQMQYV